MSVFGRRPWCTRWASAGRRIASARYAVRVLAALRMIDANANRAREALRTMEDVARFAWNDAGIVAQAKALRHGLQSALSTLEPHRLAAARDVASDIGTTLSGANEYSRGDLGAIAIAAGKRLSEALRVLEEASKTIDAAMAREIEALRYRSYELDARVVLRAALGRARQWKLCALITRALCVRPWEEVVVSAMDGGVDAIQVREKEMTPCELLAHVRMVRAFAEPRGVATIVNDSLEVALAANAEGVHLGTDDLPIREARRIAGASLLIGASTHSIEEARAAIEGGADYCGVGSMYASTLKPHLAPHSATHGEASIRAFVAEFPDIPHLAIGGIVPGRVTALARAGCRGLAVSTALCGAADPARIARELLAELASAAPATSPESSTPRVHQ